jgi:hypothetical protein
MEFQTESFASWSTNIQAADDLKSCTTCSHSGGYRVAVVRDTPPWSQLNANRYFDHHVAPIFRINTKPTSITLLSSILSIEVKCSSKLSVEFKRRCIPEEKLFMKIVS